MSFINILWKYIGQNMLLQRNSASCTIEFLSTKLSLKERKKTDVSEYQRNSNIRKSVPSHDEWEKHSRGCANSAILPCRYGLRPDDCTHARISTGPPPCSGFLCTSEANFKSVSWSSLCSCAWAFPPSSAS